MNGLRILMLLFFFFLSHYTFASDKTFCMSNIELNSLEIQKDGNSYNYKNRQKIGQAGSVAMASIGATVLSGGMALTGIFSFFVATSGWFFILGGTGLIGANGVMITGVLLLYSGIHRLIYLSKHSYTSSSAYYNKQIISRNCAVILLATSSIPLAGIVASAVGMCLKSGRYSYVDSLSILPIITGSIFMLAQIIPGVCLLASFFRKNYFSPEISMSHNPKKDITEGYEVNFGLRVRL